MPPGPNPEPCTGPPAARAAFAGLLDTTSDQLGHFMIIAEKTGPAPGVDTMWCCPVIGRDIPGMLREMATTIERQLGINPN